MTNRGAGVLVCVIGDDFFPGEVSRKESVLCLQPVSRSKREIREAERRFSYFVASRFKLVGRRIGLENSVSKLWEPPFVVDPEM